MNIASVFDQDAASRLLDPSKVLNQFYAALTRSVGVMIVFIALRPKNKTFYEPIVKHFDRTSSGLLGWIRQLIRVKGLGLIDNIGLDAAGFLRVLRMVRTILSLVALLTCVVLIPINVAYNLRHVPSSDRNLLSILTIRNVRGNHLFGPVGMVYVIPALVMVVVWFYWSTIMRLRAQFFHFSKYARSSDAVLTVMHVPKELRSGQGNLPHLIEVHDDTVRKFERVLVQNLKGGKIDEKRPTILLGDFSKMGGETKDAIDYYAEKLRQAKEAVENYRDQTGTSRDQPENYGFVRMASAPHADVVAQLLKNERPKGTRIILTPDTKDIAQIWENLNKSQAKPIIKKVSARPFSLSSSS